MSFFALAHNFGQALGLMGTHSLAHQIRIVIATTASAIIVSIATAVAFTISILYIHTRFVNWAYFFIITCATFFITASVHFLFLLYIYKHVLHALVHFMLPCK